MTKTETLSGQCACGSVTFTASTAKTYGLCHCGMCRRWTGHVWAGARFDDEPEIDGPLKIWKSSKIAERASCAKCGSPVFHRSRHSKIGTLGQGLFHDQSGWTLNREIFADEKPEHIKKDDRPIFTGWGAIWAILTGKIPK